MTEQYANKAQTTIAEDLDNSETVVTVTSNTGFPTAGGGDQYRVIVDDEIMIVTAKAGGGNVDWTVTRGAEGTAAASHSNGANITHILTAASLLALPVGSVAASTIWDKAGQIAIATGADAAAVKFRSLICHLDAALGVTKDGGDLVSVWRDQSGYGNTFHQPTGSLQPLWVTSILNSLPVMRFQGVDEYLLCPRITISAIDQFTWMLVMVPRDASATEGVFSIGGGPSDSSPLSIIQRNGTDIRWYFNGGYRYTIANATNTAALWTFQWDGVNLEVFLDGASQGTSAQGYSGNSHTMFLGAGFSTPSQVDIAEVMLFRECLKGTDRSDIEDALMTKYGL